MGLEEKYKNMVATYARKSKDNDEFEAETFGRRKSKLKNKFDDDFIEFKKEKRNKKGRYKEFY